MLSYQSFNDYDEILCNAAFIFNHEIKKYKNTKNPAFIFNHEIKKKPNNKTNVVSNWCKFWDIAHNIQTVV